MIRKSVALPTTPPCHCGFSTAADGNLQIPRRNLWSGCDSVAGERRLTSSWTSPGLTKRLPDAESTYCHEAVTGRRTPTMGDDTSEREITLEQMAHEAMWSPPPRKIFFTRRFSVFLSLCLLATSCKKYCRICVKILWFMYQSWKFSRASLLLVYSDIRKHLKNGGSWQLCHQGMVQQLQHF